jgi:hypothetical protein
MSARTVVLVAALVGVAGASGVAGQTGIRGDAGQGCGAAGAVCTDGESIEGEVVYRAPSTRWVKYRLQLGGNGQPVRYGRRCSAERCEGRARLANATMTFLETPSCADVAWAGG